MAGKEALKTCSLPSPGKQWPPHIIALVHSAFLYLYTGVQSQEAPKFCKTLELPLTIVHEMNGCSYDLYYPTPPLS